MLLDRNSLEMLIMDEQAGALSAEAAQLLEIYLAQNPEAAREAEALRETMNLAHMALASEPKSVLPKPAFAVPSIAESRPFSRFSLPAWAAMAACLAIGFLTDKLWLYQPVPVRETVQEPVSTMAVATVQSGLPANTTPFWSVKNWQFHTNDISRRGGFTLEWDSPLKKPRIKSNS